MIFKGTATALITPFTRDGVDFESLDRILDDQLAGGVDAVVVLGTTGEPATMTMAEKRAVIEFAVKKLKGKLPVIVGTGANSTAAAVEMSVTAESLGADALLLVTPYYNKATQNGLIAHFAAVADAVHTPIICYNVPGRTGVNMLPATFAELAEHPNIAAIKEASGNMEQIEEAIRLAGDKAVVYSGDDGITVPVMAMGGMGVISVVSNAAPRFTSEMTSAFLSGDLKKAAKMQLEMLPFVRAMFCEVNPIPVKKAMQLRGLCNGILRLPLTEMTAENAAKLEKLMPAFV